VRGDLPLNEVRKALTQASKPTLTA
jgi:hypothetical protein